MKLYTLDVQYKKKSFSTTPFHVSYKLDITNEQFKSRIEDLDLFIIMTKKLLNIFFVHIQSKNYIEATLEGNYHLKKPVIINHEMSIEFENKKTALKFQKLLKQYLEQRMESEEAYFKNLLEEKQA